MVMLPLLSGTVTVFRINGANAMKRAVSVAPTKKHTNSVTTTIQTGLKVMKGKV